MDQHPEPVPELNSQPNPQRTDSPQKDKPNQLLEQTQQPLPPKHANYLVPLLVIIIALLLGLVGSLIAWDHYDTSSVTYTSRSNAPNNVKTLASVYTGWHTFVDNKRIFMLKFPLGWLERGHSGNGLDSNGNPVDRYAAHFAPLLSSYPSFTVWSYYNNNPAQVINDFYLSGAPTNPQLTSVNGYQEYKYPAQSSGGITDQVIVIYHNGIGLLFDFETQTTTSTASSNQPQYASSEQATFNKIINSVSFTVPNSATTFTNYFTPITYLKIPELGLELPTNSALSGLYYVWDGNAAYLFLPSIDQMAHSQSPQTCSAGPIKSISGTQNNFQYVGVLSQGYSGPDSQLDITTINNKIYNLAGNTGGCAFSQTVVNALRSSDQNLIESFNQAKTI